MSFYRFREPLPEEYDTDDDYQEAHEMWEWAESDYEEECLELARERE